MGKWLVFNPSHIHDLMQQDANDINNPIVWFTNDGPIDLNGGRVKRLQFVINYEDLTRIKANGHS
jgi:hypothetical protein